MIACNRSIVKILTNLGVIGPTACSGKITHPSGLRSGQSHTGSGPLDSLATARQLSCTSRGLCGVHLLCRWLYWVRSVRRCRHRHAWPTLPASGPWTQPLGGAFLGAQPRTNQGTEGIGLGFRVLTVATVASTFALVTLGGAVRLTESGLGCPDWPLCHGKLIPPFDTHTLIEYSHRLLASFVGVLVLAIALVVWRSHRRQPWLFIPASLGLVLMAVQVMLGGLAVIGELPGGIVLAHLAVAEALMLFMVVVCLVALRGAPAPMLQYVGGGWRAQLPMLTLGAVLGAYLLLLTGSYVTVSGSAVACGQSWPLCQGQILPDGYYSMVHMIHRVAGLLVGLLILYVLVLAWRERDQRRYLGFGAAAVGGLFALQVSIGAAIIWMGFPIAARLLHLAMATMMLMSLAALAIFAYSAPEARVRGSSYAQA